MFVMAGIVASVGVFDLDHFGAEIGQRLRAGRPGNDPGEVDDQQTIQRSRFAPLRAAFAPAIAVLAVISGISLVYFAWRNEGFRRDFKAFLPEPDPEGNAKPRFYRAGPAADIALAARGAAHCHPAARLGRTDGNARKDGRPPRICSGGRAAPYR